ncbi:MAG: hypothetical protein COB45_06970 [Gammaproteobacteria bacterium]|nr:MAG: hypothetical protein COB45_06970 [Gammaproteobacteria bacterium]PHR82482.1 MAG: hypothetical protein COA59_14320 [Colwellia sp.]
MFYSYHWMTLIAAVINICFQLKIISLIKTLVIPPKQAIFSFLFFITLITDKMIVFSLPMNPII